MSMPGPRTDTPLARRLAGFLEHRPQLGPETVHIDITNACNLDCVTCWNYAPGLTSPKSMEWKRQRMAPALFHRLIGEIAALGVERIIISGGGEPFAHPSIYDFIADVKTHGLALTIISNGTLCDYDRLRIEPRPDQMLINLAAACSKTYCAYHPNQPPETFGTLIENLRSISGIIRLNLVQVINRLNHTELPQMIELAADIGARSSFKLGGVPPGTEALELSAKEKRKLLDKLIPKARKCAKALKSKHNLDAFSGQLEDSGGKRFIDTCFAGYLYSRIHVDGRVFFCCEHIDVGHVDDGNFAMIWSSPAYQAARNRLHAGHFFPGCQRCGKYDMNHDAALALAALQRTPDAAP